MVLVDGTWPALHLACTPHDRLSCHLADYVRCWSDTTLVNVNAHRYVGKVVPERIYVGSLFRHSNVNTALHDSTVLTFLLSWAALALSLITPGLWGQCSTLSDANRLPVSRSESARTSPLLSKMHILKIANVMFWRITKVHSQFNGRRSSRNINTPSLEGGGVWLTIQGIPRSVNSHMLRTLIFFTTTL